MRFGSRKRLGAASIPEIAPSTAARPQPSESIHVTRTPTSRASAGLTAAARIARPTFVYWKSAHSTTTVASTTPIVDVLDRDRDTGDVDRAGRERALHGAHLPRPDQRHEAVEREQKADGDDHDAEHGAFLVRPDDPLVDRDPAGER